MSSRASKTSTNTASSPIDATAATQVQRHSPAQQVSQWRGWAEEGVLRIGLALALTGRSGCGRPSHGDVEAERLFRVRRLNAQRPDRLACWLYIPVHKPDNTSEDCLSAAHDR